MGQTITITGKGGSGKTTIAELLLVLAASRGLNALGVDADAQRSLTLVATSEAGDTLYQQLEEGARLRRAGGMPRAGYQQALADSLTRTAAGYDLLTMGRPTGEGCYCAANAAVKQLLFGGEPGGGLALQYDLVIVDCEAGPEKIARRMLTPGSTALVVATPDRRGQSIRVADAIAEAIGSELAGVRVMRILNRVPPATDLATLPAAWQTALMLAEGEPELAVCIPVLLDQLRNAEVRAWA